MRTLAIGDIHGCSAALELLLEAVKATSADRLVFLGDYVDRGPDSAGVLDQLIEISEECPHGTHPANAIGVLVELRQGR